MNQMSPQIQFRPGHPHKFIATKSFALGNTGHTVPLGGEIDFDGTMASYGGYPAVAMPFLRGAIRVGWIVPADEYDPSLGPARPVSANVQIRQANGGNPMEARARIPITTVEAEEQEVASIRAHSNSTTQRNASNYRRDPRHPNVQVEEQDGRPVRRVQTPARQGANFEHMSPHEAISRANSIQVQPGQGMTREEMISQMNEGERELYLAELDARKSAYVDEPVAVGRVPAPRTQEREGFTVRSSVGNGIDIADLGGTGIAGKEQVSQVESEGIRFANTNGPKRGVRLVDTPASKPLVSTPHAPADDDMCRKIAKSVCPDFPDNYLFSDPIRKKIARLQADFEDRPDVIRAVAAAETDAEVKRRLVDEFPAAFG